MWCACDQSERTTSCKGKIPGQREITQPGGRSYLCKCDLAGYEMEICIPAAGIRLFNVITPAAGIARSVDMNPGSRVNTVLQYTFHSFPCTRMAPSQKRRQYGAPLTIGPKYFAKSPSLSGPNNSVVLELGTEDLRSQVEQRKWQEIRHAGG